MYLICLCCAWLTGIVLGSNISVSPVFLLAGLVPLLFLPFISRYKKTIILAGFCLLFFITGAIYSHASLPGNGETDLRYYNDRGDILFKGLVDREPERSERTTRLTLKGEAIFLNGEWMEISGTVLAFVPFYPEYGYGDYLLVKGSLETPQQIDEFDYETYLAGKGIYSTLYYPEIEVLDTGKGIKLMEWIYSFRNNIAAVINKTMPEPQASLAKGILLGMRAEIPASTRDDFSHTGTSHLLAISGLHLGIIAGIFITIGIRIFGRQRYLYIWMTLAAIWIYAVLTGMNPPVLRSVQMISLFLAADLFGRQRSAIIALVFAAALIAAFSPRILWDPSFQMSFAAMAGLIFILPPVQILSRKLIHSRLGEDGVIAAVLTTAVDCFSVSFSAVIAVWPLIAYYFGAVSPTGPAATFFALPALPGIILTTAIGGITGLLFLPFAQVIAWMGWLCTSYVLLVVKVFNFIPSAENIGTGIIPVVVYYVILIIILWFVYRRDRKPNISAPSVRIISFIPGKWLIIPLALISVIVWITAFTIPDGKLHISFLDIGQGDAILIQMNNRQVLVDGGPDPQTIITELGNKMPFWNRTIDMVVMTHPDADHITGLMEVLKRYEIKQVLYTPAESDSVLYSEFLRLLDETDATPVRAEAGQRIMLDQGIYLDVINPYAAKQSSNIDNDSVVVCLKSGNISFLLTGDITGEGEYRLLSRRAVEECTVLKAAHHGSSSSTTTEFLNVVNPAVVVISAGKDNRYGHPSEDALSRIEAAGNPGIYRTDIHGTIEFIIDGEDIRVRTDY